MTTETTSKSSPGTILLVDDEQQIRFLLKNHFRSAGFGVIEAECGLTALALFEQNRVDVLVTDIEMPNMDGITLAERCKRQFPDLRVVIISGFTERLIPNVGTMVDAVFQKPFSPKAVVSTVKRVLQMSSGPAS
jgi:two-component system cell cycle sensor histidine kinase/response regulator CckA